jgi:DNA polymerase III sliding clamp (beta) subunit (PCNA family)
MDTMWEFNRSDLLAVLGVASASVPSDHPIGLFVSDGQQVALVTDNKRVVTKQVIPTGPLFPGTQIVVGAPVIAFARVVKAMTGDRVSVSVDNGRFMLKDNTAAAAAVTAFPPPSVDTSLLVFDDASATVVKRSKLETITKSVSHVVGSEDGPTSGIRVSRTTTETTFVATDRYRLHLITASGLYGGGEPATIPLEGFRTALAAIKTATMSVSASDTGMVFLSPTAVVAARAIPGEFPAWHQVVRMPPQDEIEATVTFDGPGLHATAKRVAAAVGGDLVTLELDPDGGAVTVSGRSDDGSISVVSPAAVKGGMTTVVYQRRNLLDVLGCLAGEATMTVCASNRPVLFHSGDGTFRAAVAPSRSPVG